MPDPGQLGRLRSAAARAPKAFKQMTARLARGGLALSEDQALKRAPRGFEDVDDPEIDRATRLKHMVCERKVAEASDPRAGAGRRLLRVRLGFAAVAHLGLGRPDRFAIGSPLMAEVHPDIDASCRRFIARQRIFFAASAAPGARVNFSPRGTDALAILDERTVAFLDKTGSGNETAAHLKADGRLTLMFCAFEGPPNILRLYGRGEVLRRGSQAYVDLLAGAFAGAEPLGARQIVRLHVDRVQTSCGYGAPLFEYRGERPSLDNWARAKGEDGLEAYRREKNAVSIDGLPTGVFDDA